MTTREKELVGLRESEARTRIVMETISDAVLTIDEASTKRWVVRRQWF